MNTMPRFYINPNTGRLIKSTGRVYKNLRKHRQHTDKHVCLYNQKSVERCVKKILTLYPDTLYPPSSLIEIPKTFDHGSIRAFIRDPQTGMLIGYIDRMGDKYRLQKPISVTDSLPIVQDNYNVLASLIKSLQPIQQFDQDTLEQNLLTYKPVNDSSNIVILFNPLKNDFVPINSARGDIKDLDFASKDILRIINQELVPKNLFPIRTDYNFAGLVRDDSTLYGIVDINNQFRRFQEAISIDTSDDTESVRSAYTAPEIQKKIHSIENKIDYIESIVTNIADTTFSIVESLNKQSSIPLVIPKQIADTLPEVTVLAQTHTQPLSDAIAKAPVLNSSEQKEILEQIQCLDGEQYDVNEKRCLPCDQYNLVWDPTHKLCKPMLKTDIQTLQTEQSVETLIEDPKTPGEDTQTLIEDTKTLIEDTKPIEMTVADPIKILFNGFDEILGYL